MISTWIIFIATLIISVMLHEIAHGWVALRLGDSTAKSMGRLSLNPLRHIDLFWTILLPAGLLFLGLPPFAVAKPVPVNFANLSQPKSGMMWVALAGPMMNFLIACVLALAYQVTHAAIFILLAYFNLGFMVFNLLPIPPLDGSRVLLGLLPSRAALWFFRIERYQTVLMIILFFLVWNGLLHRMVWPAVDGLAMLLGLPRLQN